MSDDVLIHISTVQGIYQQEFSTFRSTRTCAALTTPTGRSLNSGHCTVFVLKTVEDVLTWRGLWAN